LLNANKKGLSFERPFVFDLNWLLLGYSSSTKGDRRLLESITAQFGTNEEHPGPILAQSLFEVKM
jgi:hypothetical protein